MCAVWTISGLHRSVRHLKVMKLQCFVDNSAAIFFGELVHVVIIILVLPPGVVCSSNRALPMLGTADGDAVSRCQVLGRAGSVHHAGIHLEKDVCALPAHCS